MQTIGISLVKNEEDIIESFVRHNLQFLDGIIILDNCSTDATRPILKMLMQEGLPICLCDDDEYAHLQSEKITNLLQRVSSAIPVEFIIPLDADEFIECESRQKFEVALSRISSPGIGLWGWKTYLLSPDVASAEAKSIAPEQFHFFRIRELPQYYKVILRNPLQCIDDLVVSQGSHSVISGHNLPIAQLNDICLAHFPVRSKSQIVKKVIFGKLAYEVKEKQQNKKFPSEVYQWRKLFHQLMMGQEFSEIELMNISINYAQIPGQLKWPENVRYGKFCSEQLIRRYDGLIKGNLLLEIVRSFQTYITGLECPFNPDELHQLEAKLQDEINSSSGNKAFEPNWQSEKFFLDIPPFKFLYERFLPDSILDIGCGVGHYLKLLTNFGATQVLGIDAVQPKALYISQKNYIKHDLGQLFYLHQRFDLVICSEVAEQLTPGSEETLLSNIEAHAGNLIFFSAAAPSQSGDRSISRQSFSLWAEAWAARGWVPLLFETLCFRALSTFSWLRKNSVIMTRSHDNSDAFVKWLPLISSSKADDCYHPQFPSIIVNPLKYNVLL